VRQGLTPAQAGNLVARLTGIAAAPGGWSIEEVERLEFTRWMRETGHLSEHGPRDHR
jgi:hypothetical protein